MGVAGYSGKCDKCEKIDPQAVMPVSVRISEGAWRNQLWCLDCVRQSK